MPDLSLHFPGEALAIELVKLVGKVLDGQPPEVRAELWKMHLEDIKAWRSLFKGDKP